MEIANDSMEGLNCSNYEDTEFCEDLMDRT